ncbi:hypothetical protein F7725_017999, partial [Dissostichus mawsoni]
MGGGDAGWTVRRRGEASSRDPMTWVRHVTVAQERKSIHERMRSTGVDYRLGPWLLEGWREVEGGSVGRRERGRAWLLCGEKGVFEGQL